MTTFQKIVKYLAVIFAFFLVFSIIASIVSVLSFVFGFSYKPSVEAGPFEIEGIPNSIEIELASSSLIIKKGDSFSVETDNDHIDVKQYGDKLKIREEKIFNIGDGGTVTLIVSDDSDFEKVDIDSGAGVITIETLITNELELDLGAGKIEVEHIVVKDTADIDGGAGKIIIKDGEISDLNLDMGVGDMEFTSKVSGDNKINFGIGKADIVLVGDTDDYKLRFDKGLGSAEIDGENMISGELYGEGSSFIDMHGGIGSVEISFK